MQDFDPTLKCCYVECQTKAKHSEIAAGKGHLWDVGYWLCDECNTKFGEELNGRVEENGSACEEESNEA